MDRNRESNNIQELIIATTESTKPRHRHLFRYCLFVRFQFEFHLYCENLFDSVGSVVLYQPHRHRMGAESPPDGNSESPEADDVKGTEVGSSRPPAANFSGKCEPQSAFVITKPPQRNCPAIHTDIPTEAKPRRHQDTHTHTHT